MKKIKAVVVGSLVAAALAACAYTGVGANGDKAVIARTDFIYGLFRKVYVCKVADNGLQACQTNESP